LHDAQLCLACQHSKDEANSADLLPLARVRVSERIAEIVHLLSVRPSIFLAEVVENEHSRLVIIVTFLAVLEMWKREQITVKQEMLMGPIVLERGARWEALIDSKNLTGIDSKFIL